MKTKRSYKQGVVEIDNHPTLKKGQIVDIISEAGDFYLVQCFETHCPEFINKQSLKVN